ncbi:MAG: exodeoxyribonuclease V subunit alpha [Candidatus Microthrix sp.]|nr:exodeoxyribonuclease V subunit alpha [Candidatus Microthrix sp.]MBK7322587.1 exodeoxyribonuclease V subunit alpha [Candidatus Microthrix sp.]
MRPTDASTSLLPVGTAVLAPFVEAGILHEAGVHVAGVVARMVPGTSDEALLATALCVRALQLGHVCVVLNEVAFTVAIEAQGEQTSPVDGAEPTAAIDDLPWPDPADWADALRSSDAVTVRDPRSGDATGRVDEGVIRPLVFDGARVYLERYWRYERQVGDLLLDQPNGHPIGLAAPPVRSEASGAAIDAVLDQDFGPDDPDRPDLQRHGARVALTRRITVLAGGPGTGKTHTVARLLAALHQLAADDKRPLQVALAAPTGKAAARMTEAVHQAVAGGHLPKAASQPLLANEAGTIHRLLGHRDGISFRHDRTNPLPHDVVVVDETSMVALPLMARLLDALRPDARVVLVGDPFQLASVEAGAVLGDVVGPATDIDAALDGPLTDNIVVLQRVHRFAADSAIAALAHAVRSGDADLAIEVLRDTGSDDVQWIDPADRKALGQLQDTVVSGAAEVARAASEGNAGYALERAVDLKVLCGTRFGPLGSYAWRDHLERRLPKLVQGLSTGRGYYVGRPVIITRNDYISGVFNGDTGIVIRNDARTVVAMPGGPDGIRLVLPSQLAAVETWWAMTIHKSQGSEFAHAVVSLPDARSRVLTRELLYTGITRGKEKVTVVASEAALRRAIDSPVARASGLRARLWKQ